MFQYIKPENRGNCPDPVVIRPILCHTIIINSAEAIP